MPDLKELLGDAYKDGMTIDEVNTALKDRKIVDLASGEYVGKGKYDAAVKERDEARKERDEANEKHKDYDELVKYRDENEAAKTAKALEETLKGYGVKPDMLEFVRFQVDSGKIERGEKDKDLEANVKKFLKDNPQYAAENQNSNHQNNHGGGGPRINTGGNPGGDPGDGGYKPAKKVTQHSWNRRW